MARIIAIVDAYDGMLHDRSYKRTLSQTEAIGELRRCAGHQFDQRLAELFIGFIVFDNAAG